MPARKTETNETEVMEPKSVFETLNRINVNDKTEKKNGLTYLSWAWAWAEVKKAYPNAYYTIYERDTEYGPVNYFTDGRTCWVKTGLTIEGLEHIEELPVMDFRNNSIPIDRVTSFEVNKSIQRSLTKAAARHGIGLYIYAGEDLPEESDGSNAVPEKQARPKTAAKQTPEKPAETKAEHNTDTATLINEIADKLEEIKVTMPGRDERMAFAKETILPIIGSMNYKTCNDVVKLTALRDKLCS